MCSQPIEQDAQLLRATPRSSSSCLAASFGASANVAAVKLRVGSVLTALKASRLASVPSSRYFAVAGPKLRARRSRAAARTASWSWTATLAPALTSTALRFLAPSTAPRPPRPACRPSWEIVAYRTPRSPAGPIAAVRQPWPKRCFAAASASAADSPVRSAAGSSRTPSASTSSTDSWRARPRTTIASLPVSLPAIANWLDASASVSRPVSGDFATTANFALVVSGVPTSGENTKASAASGPNGSTSGGVSRCSSQVPSPTPPRYPRSTRSSRSRPWAVAAVPLTSTTSAQPKYPPGAMPRLYVAHPPGCSASGVGREERHRVAGDQRQPGIPHDVVAVDRRDHVPVEGEVDGRRRFAQAGRGHRPGSAPVDSGQRAEALDRDVGSGPGPGPLVLLPGVDVLHRVERRVGRGHRGIGEQHGVVRLHRAAVLQQHAGPQVALGDLRLDQSGQRGPVPRREWLPIPTHGRQHQVHGGIVEPADDGPDVRGVQERQVGRADERRAGPVPHRGQSRRHALHRPEPLDRVLRGVDALGQVGQLLPGSPYHDDRPVDRAGHHGGRAEQQRRTVPLQPRLGLAHTRRRAAGEHHCRHWTRHPPILGAHAWRSADLSPSGLPPRSGTVGHRSTTGLPR